MNKYLVQISNQNFTIEGKNALNSLANLEETLCSSNYYNDDWFLTQQKKNEIIDKDMLNQNIIIKKINN